MKNPSIVCFICLFLFFLNGKAESVRYQPGPYQGTDVWLSSYYDYGSNYGVDDQYLRVGGWGDDYLSALRFDLEGLPREVSRVVLNLYADIPPGSSSPSRMFLSTVQNGWDESFGFYSTSWFGLDLGYFESPDRSSWYSLDITELYQAWKNGSIENNGIVFSPLENNNNFNYFRSSDYPEKSYRPYLEIDYVPIITPLNFKLPLPAGYKWCVTTEVGGKDAKYPDPEHEYYIDEYHTGKTYFSIDFSSSSIPSFYSKKGIPVYASASGRVISNKKNDKFNGYNVVISHDGDYDEDTGFTTKYIHLKDPPIVNYGKLVNQGQLIGYMGGTGESDGTHLHFGIYFNGDGSSDVEELCQVTLEGMPLKSFLTEILVENGVVGRSSNSYYPSTNTR